MNMMTKAVNEFRGIFLGGPGSGNPGQNRDSHGRWSSTGSGAYEAGERKRRGEQKTAAEKVAGGMPSVGNSLRTLFPKLNPAKRVELANTIASEVYTDTNPGKATVTPPAWLDDLLTQGDNGAQYDKIKGSIADLVKRNGLDLSDKTSMRRLRSTIITQLKGPRQFPGEPR